MVYLFYTTYISVDLAHHEIFCAKVGKEGIMLFTPSSDYVFGGLCCKQYGPRTDCPLGSSLIGFRLVALV